MYAKDFQYDGQCLSDYGFIIGDVDSSGMETVSAGSTITFNRVPRYSGKKYGLTSTQYDECIQAEFCIVKNPSIFSKNNMDINHYEYRDIMRWLNRRDFHKFMLVGNEDEIGTVYYYASFNVEELRIGNTLYGFKLHMETDMPFGVGEEQINTFKCNSSLQKYELNDMSDEIGCTYPDIEIKVRSNGVLNLSNETDGITMQIKNCAVGEVIKINGETRIIETNRDSHKLYNDFNFEFFRISNTINNRKNIISCSLPCDITFRYMPIIKRVI